MDKKLKVKKIKLLGQDYLIKSSESSEMLKVADYVNKKMQEVIDSGVDQNSQQLRIAVFACLEIAGELFLYREKNNKILSMGGRVLNVTCSSKSLDKAKAQSLSNLKKINWTDGFFRKDIGWRATKK